MFEPVIETARLELHHISAQGIIDLLENKDDRAAIAGRSFTNPHRVLVENSGPLGWRVPQVKENPAVNIWFVRFIVLTRSREIIGSTSFHGAPDADGMMEIGLGIEPEYRGRGLAQELLHGMWGWVVHDPLVKILRYTVSPSNEPSQAIIKKFGFTYIGQQMDEEDGPEDIFEMSAEEYRVKFSK